MTEHATADGGSTGRPGSALRRRQRIVAGCIAAITAAVAAVIIVAVTVGSSDDAGSPAAAATTYGKALLARNSGELKSITCPGHSQANDQVYFLTFAGSGVRAGTAVSLGHDKWNVPLTSTGPGGGTRITVGVERRDDKYLVC